MATRTHNSVNALAMDPFVLDTLSIEACNEGRRPNVKPLPLPQVLANIEKLHEKCVGGGHVCGLRGAAVKFDLHRDYVEPMRVYRRAYGLA